MVAHAKGGAAPDASDNLPPENKVPTENYTSSAVEVLHMYIIIMA